MKQLLLFLALLPVNLLAMQEQDGGRAYKIFSEIDGNGDVWVNDGHGGLIKENYSSFFYSLDETRSADDTRKQFSVPQPLFMQLVVQASKIKQQDIIPFHELLCRIRSGKVSIEQDPVAMTHKDAEHRLLSYIPNGKVNQLVNGKKIRMTTIVGTRLVDKGEKVENRTTVPIIEEDFPLDPAGLVFPELGQGHSSRGKETELTGEDRLSANYDFESDQEHHAKVVKEFNELFKNKLP